MARGHGGSHGPSDAGAPEAVTMRAVDDPYLIGAVIVGLVNGVAASIGFAQWTLGRPAQPFWLLARAGQVMAAVYAVVCGLYAVIATPPPDGLAWVYILTPIAVSYFAEQLRLIAATSVLEHHGFDSAAALRAAATSGDGASALDASPDAGTGADDRSGHDLVTGIAHEVILRELVVLATGALVITFLAWRAWLTG